MLRRGLSTGTLTGCLAKIAENQSSMFTYFSERFHHATSFLSWDPAFTLTSLSLCPDIFA